MNWLWSQNGKYVYCLDSNPGNPRALRVRVADKHIEVITTLGKIRRIQDAVVPDQVLLSGVLQSGAVASVHLKGGTTNGTGFLFEIHGTEGALTIVPADPRQATYIQVSEFTVRGAQAGKPLADLSIPESYRWVPPAVPTGLPFNVAQLYVRMPEGIREGNSASPDFDVAVKRHELLDVIQKASDTGICQIL